MAWKKASPEMSELLADALGPFPAEKRQMFGFPAYFANRNMFTGVLFSDRQTVLHLLAGCHHLWERPGTAHDSRRTRGGARALRRAQGLLPRLVDLFTGPAE